MNNRFKCRVWDSHENKMIYPSDEVYNGRPTVELNGRVSITRFDSKKDDLICKKNENGLHSWIDYGDWYGIEYMKLMYSIGLNDKNGKLIYEGDIVKLPHNVGSDIESYTLFKIEYCKDTASYVMICLKTGKVRWFEERMQWEGDFRFSSKKVEIIGNIYENKEILK